MKKLFFLVLSVALVFGALAHAGTIEVDINDGSCVTGSGQSDPYAVVYCNIQDAIDDATGGDTINVAAGTYVEYLHITTDNLTIQGAGIDKSIIDMDGLTPYWHYSGCGSKSFASRGGVLITGYDSPDEIVEDVTFKGFTVKNVGLNPPGVITGTHTGADDAASLTDSGASWTPGALVGQWVHNLDDRYIGTAGGNQPIRSYGLITANSATTVTAILADGLENDWDNGDTYAITPYEHFLDSSNKDGQDDVHGISVANGKNVVIEDVKVQNSGSRGITVGKARCTSLQQSENMTVKNCIVLDNHSQGISIGDHTGTITITGNTVSNNKRPHISDPTREYAGIGIYATGASSSKKITGVISGNTVSGNGFEGIALYKWVDGVTVEDNTVTGHNFDQDGAGIFFYYWGHPERCKNVIVRNNTVTGNIRGIVAYYASYCTIEGNTITTDSGDFPLGQGAIKLDGSNNIEVKDNTISCDGTGISVVYWEGYDEVSCHDNTFTGNTISGAKFAGIFISGDAHDNTFTCNTITGTTSLKRWAGKPYEETQADGVFIDDDAGTGNVFHYNYIFGNADDGMENQIATTVDAENNWWGSANGPGQDGANSISGNVDYDPWLMTMMNYTGDTLFPVSDYVVLKAKLTNSDGTPLDIDFYVGGVYEDTITTVDGIATLNIGIKNVGVYAVRAVFGCLQAEALVAVYDPTAGFVTGGGWIDSPEGAYATEPSLTGKATFGFVSKYKKGATVPTGQTEFMFKAADLNFHSNNYDWLVVNKNESRAQFKGSGTINGEGDYKFMLWASDGEQDTFRIKIWWEDTDDIEHVVYDNGFEGSGYEKGQPIGGGNIVVHTGKK